LGPCNNGVSPSDCCRRCLSSSSMKSAFGSSIFEMCRSTFLWEVESFWLLAIDYSAWGTTSINCVVLLRWLNTSGVRRCSKSDWELPEASRLFLLFRGDLLMREQGGLNFCWTLTLERTLYSASSLSDLKSFELRTLLPASNCTSETLKMASISLWSNCYSGEEESSPCLMMWKSLIMLILTFSLSKGEPFRPISCTSTQTLHDKFQVFKAFLE